MALPVTISGAETGSRNSYHGPFKSSGGKYYTIVLDSGSLNTLEAWEATDPTSSFSEVDSANKPAPGDDVLSLWCFQDSDQIHIAYQDSVDDVRYSRFNMATGTWDIVSGGLRSVLVAGSPNGTADACSIMVRSDGSIVVAYQGVMDMDMGSSFERIDYRVSVIGSVWSGAVSVNDTGGSTARHWTSSVIVKGSSDRAHIFFRDQTNALGYQRTLTNSDVLETFQSSFASNIGGTGYNFHHGVSYDDAGTQRVRCPFSGGSPNRQKSARLDSADAPTVITEDISDGLGASIISLAADGTDLHALFAGVDVSELDLYHDLNSNGAGWGTDDEVLDAVTVNHVSSNVYDRSGTKLAYIYDDGGIVKYNEVDIGGASGVTITVPVDGITITNNAPVVSTGTNVQAVLDAINLADLVPQVGTSALVTAPADALAVTDFAPLVASGGGGVAPLDGIPVTDLVPIVATGANVTPPADTVPVSDFVPQVGTGAAVAPPADGLGITDFSPFVATGVGVLPPVDAIPVTNLVPQVITTVNIQPPADGITLSHLVPAVGTGVALSVPVDVLTISGLVPLVSIGINVVAPKDSIPLSDLVPIVASGAAVAPPADAIPITDFIPVIGIGVNVAVLLDTLTVTEFAPGVFIGVNVAPSLDAISINDLVPAVGSGASVAPPADTVPINEFPPQVGSDIVIAPPLDALVITGFDPIIGTGVTITVPQDAIPIIGFNPSVSQIGGVVSEVRFLYGAEAPLAGGCSGGMGPDAGL